MLTVNGLPPDPPPLTDYPLSVLIVSESMMFPPFPVIEVMCSSAASLMVFD